MWSGLQDQFKRKRSIGPPNSPRVRLDMVHYLYLKRATECELADKRAKLRLSPLFAKPFRKAQKCRIRCHRFGMKYTSSTRTQTRLSSSSASSMMCSNRRCTSFPLSENHWQGRHEHSKRRARVGLWSHGARIATNITRLNGIDDTFAALGTASEPLHPRRQARVMNSTRQKAPRRLLRSRGANKAHASLAIAPC